MIADFHYLRASTKEDALRFLAEHTDDAKVICGGQSLLILMRQGLVAPAHLIDIKNADGMRYIAYDATDGLRIGATTTHREVETSEVVGQHYPVLVHMEENLASVQTRNYGSIGGNLVHADPVGDPAPVLMALNATLKLASAGRQRLVPVEEFCVDFFETVLAPDELLAEIHVPPVPPRTASAYEKFNIIKNDQGVVSVAASVSVSADGAKCEDARLIIGGAASTPLRVPEAEERLRGQALGPEVLAEAAQAASDAADPVTDIHATAEYRKHLVGALAQEVIQTAWDRARASV